MNSRRLTFGVFVAISLGATAMSAVAAPAEGGLTGSTSGCVSHVRWVITTARGVPFTQAAELTMFNDAIPLPNRGNNANISVTSPGGFSEAPPEGPESAYDGDIATKWIDFALAAGQESTLLIHFPEPVVFDSYQWTTAGAEPERDPISWRLDVSADGVSWTTVDTRSNYAVTENRSSVVGPFTNTSLGCNTVASELSITTQPSMSAASGAAFAQQPTVQLLDVSGNAVSQAGVVVTAAIASGGGTLGGTLTATTDTNGLATFTNLSITRCPGD